MGKNILLVNPPSGFLADERVFLPLGIAYIAATAMQNGHEVKLLDLAGSATYVDDVVRELSSRTYDAVGITATSPQFHYAHHIREGISAANIPVKTILGGTHASMFASVRDRMIQEYAKSGVRKSDDIRALLYDHDPNFVNLEKFDVLASGEEGSLEAALNSNGQQWVDGGIITDMAKVPMPARHLFDVKSYLVDPNGTPKFKIGGMASGSLISQRGCPFKCEFCCGRDSPMYHKPNAVVNGKVIPRSLSPEQLIAELDHMNQAYGLSSFMFYDDEFNLDHRRTVALCTALAEHNKKGHNYQFRGFVKSDLLTKHPEVAYAMKAAGFLEVLTGVESGSKRILTDHLHKFTSPDINYSAAEICVDAGLGFKALTMLGHTSETESDIMMTRDWLMRVGNMYERKVGPGKFTFDLTVFQPYPGSPIWDKAQPNTNGFSDEYPWVYHSRKAGQIVDPQHGGIYIKKVDFATEAGFYKGVPGDYKAFIRTDDVSAKRFVYLRDQIEHEVRDKFSLGQIAKASYGGGPMGQAGNGGGKSN